MCYTYTEGPTFNRDTNGYFVEYSFILLNIWQKIQTVFNTHNYLIPDNFKLFSCCK